MFTFVATARIYTLAHHSPVFFFQICPSFSSSFKGISLQPFICSKECTTQPPRTRRLLHLQPLGVITGIQLLEARRYGHLPLTHWSPRKERNIRDRSSKRGFCFLMNNKLLGFQPKNRRKRMVSKKSTISNTYISFNQKSCGHLLNPKSCPLADFLTQSGLGVLRKGLQSPFAAFVWRFGRRKIPFKSNQSLKQQMDTNGS